MGTCTVPMRHICVVNARTSLRRHCDRSSYIAFFLETNQATAGLIADGKHLANRARDEAVNFRETYRYPTPLKVRCTLNADPCALIFAHY